MLKKILMLSMFVTTFFGTSAVMACTTNACHNFFWPPSRCAKSFILNKEEGILSVTYEEFTTFASSHGSTDTNSCVIAVAIPGGSGILSVEQVQVLDAYGDVFDSFENFVPNEETSFAFKKMLIGLPVQWTGFQGVLIEPIAGGEKVQVVIDFKVDPKVPKNKLMRSLNSAVLAMDTGNADGTPAFGHLSLNFGLSDKSFPACVKEMTAIKCEGLTGKTEKTCKLRSIRKCSELFDVNAFAN